jgi:predicted AAA+ superfamily ATPase
MWLRHLQSHLLKAMGDTPVTFLAGARQTGKSTLVKALQTGLPDSSYQTFDDLNTLGSAKDDPVGFLDRLPAQAFLDEVQRAPELFLPIKASVDRDRRFGRFILTGSANIMLLPRIADSLAGRMEILTLWPLAQAEIQGVVPGFIDACFQGDPGSLKVPVMERGELWQRALAGGYPEVLERGAGEGRERWFDSYLTTLIQRDLRALADIESVHLLPRLLSTLAARAGSTLNQSDLALTLGISLMTVKRYLALLETLYLLVTLPPWFENLGKRLAKTPKLYFNDSALLAHLLGIEAAGLAAQPHLAGPILETFTVMELTKTAPWSRARPALYHFRTSAGREVDVVLENRRRELVAVEVKAAATVQSADFKGIRELQSLVGERLKAGILLHAGKEILPFGPGLWAMPFQALWSQGPLVSKA